MNKVKKWVKAAEWTVKFELYCDVISSSDIVALLVTINLRLFLDYLRIQLSIVTLSILRAKFEGVHQCDFINKETWISTQSGLKRYFISATKDSLLPSRWPSLCSALAILRFRRSSMRLNKNCFLDCYWVVAKLRSEERRVGKECW